MRNDVVIMLHAQTIVRHGSNHVTDHEKPTALTNCPPVAGPANKSTAEVLFSIAYFTRVHAEMHINNSNKKAVLSQGNCAIPQLFFSV